MNIGLLINKVLRSIREQGISETLKRARSSLRYLRPGQVIDDFDRRYGTDTATVLPLWQLHVSSPNAKYGRKYQACREGDIEAAMEFIGQPTSRFAFVDLGSGKGRSLILATRLGFRSIIGVEFARELVEISKKNLAIVGNTVAVSLQMDATEYEFPPGDLVINMFNPFMAQVMTKVVENIRRARLARGTDEIYVVYSNPECADVLDRASFLERLGNPAGWNDIVIWKARKP